MSKFNKPSPRVEAFVGGDTEFIFTYRDTVLIGFHNAYQKDDPSLDFSHMNNVRHTTPDGEDYNIYESHNLWRELARLAFTRIIKPYPDDDDIEDYAQFFAADINGEVGRHRSYDDSGIEEDWDDD